jgi:hypothetical protein
MTGGFGEAAAPAATEGPPFEPRDLAMAQITSHASPPADGGPERRAKFRGHLSLFWDALFKTLRFIARHVQNVYAVVGIFIAFGLLVALGGVWIFVQIAGEVRQGTTQAFDVAVLRYI